MPTVSVILPVYNEEDYINHALDSILGQSYKDLEVVIIDDGSNDNTKHIIRSRNDKRIRYHRHNNKGITKSLNKGIKLSNGQFIARMDADDISELDRIRCQLDYIKKRQNTHIVGSWYNVIDESGNIVTTKKISFKKGVKKQLKQSSTLCHGSVMMRKKAVQELGGYNENFKYAQDYELWVRAYNRGYKFGIIKKVLYNFRITRHSITNRKGNEQKYYAERAKSKLTKEDIRVESISSKIDNNRTSKDSVYYYLIGTSMVKSGKRCGAFKYLLKSIVQNPRQVKGYVRLFTCILPTNVCISVNKRLESVMYTIRSMFNNIS
jgi:glycosyltransferase involved in cell wall biosynthesis